MKDEISPKARRAAKYAGMSEAALVQQNQRAIGNLEALWAEVEARLCARAGDDRTSRDAIHSAEAGAIKHRLMALHRDMDAFAARAGGVPSTRIGDR